LFRVFVHTRYKVKSIPTFSFLIHLNNNMNRKHFWILVHLFPNGIINNIYDIFLFSPVHLVTTLLSFYTQCTTYVRHIRTTRTLHSTHEYYSLVYCVLYETLMSFLILLSHVGKARLNALMCTLELDSVCCFHPVNGCVSLYTTCSLHFNIPFSFCSVLLEII